MDHRPRDPMQGSEESGGPERSAAGMGLARATLLIAALTAASSLLGFVREAVFAAIFGASAEFDAYLVALGLPNVAISLIATAVVTSSIPVLSGYLRRDEEGRARRTFNTLFTFVLLALIVASGLLAIFAEPLVRLSAPGFDESQVDLSVELARILLIASVLVAAMNLVTGLLQAHREFFWPAIVGIPFNVVMITAAALFGGDAGVVALAVGFVLASAVRVVVQFPGLRKIRFQPAPSLAWRDPGLRAVLVLAPVVLLGHSISNVNTIVDRLVGSTQVDGTISALNYGYRLVTLPHGLLALALVQAFYPSLGAAAATRDTAELRALLERGLTALTLVILPIAAALIVLRIPLVELVYARGSFSTFDVALTADAVAFYALGVVFLAWRDLAARVLYAQRSARAPVLAALIGMLVNVAGDLTLGQAFGVSGLAASTTLALGVALGVLLVLLNRGDELVRVRAFGSMVARAGVAALAAAAAMHGAQLLLHAVLVGGPVEPGIPGKPLQLALVGGPAVAGLASYTAVLALLAPAELRALLQALIAGLRERRGGRRAG